MVSAFVSLYGNSFVSQSGWWCPALWLSPIHLSPLIADHFSPSLDGVRLAHGLQFICLPSWQFIKLVSNSFVFPYSSSLNSQSGWCCPALWLSPIHLSPLKGIHLPPNLARGVRLFACLQFMCLPLKQVICLPVWLAVSGSLAVEFMRLPSLPL